MRVDLFTMHLTCDAIHCSLNGLRYTSYYESEDKGGAINQAIEEGWHLGKEDLCPQCAREKDG